MGQSKHCTSEIDLTSEWARSGETREGWPSDLWERLCRSTHPNGCGERNAVDQRLFSTGLDVVQSYPGWLPIHNAWEEHPIRSKHHGDQHPMERHLCTRASTACGSMRSQRCSPARAWPGPPECPSQRRPRNYTLVRPSSEGFSMISISRANSSGITSAAATATRAGVVAFTGERSHRAPVEGLWSARDIQILSGGGRNSLEVTWVSRSIPRFSPEVPGHGNMRPRGRPRWRGEPKGRGENP